MEGKVVGCHSDRTKQRLKKSMTHMWAITIEKIHFKTHKCMEMKHPTQRDFKNDNMYAHTIFMHEIECPPHHHIHTYLKIFCDCLPIVVGVLEILHILGLVLMHFRQDCVHPVLLGTTEGGLVWDQFDINPGWRGGRFCCPKRRHLRHYGCCLLRSKQGLG